MIRGRSGRLVVPDELIALSAERRVIPFVGAGFSANAGLPNWEALLARLSDEVDTGFSFEEIKKMANGDYLQIAEYLYIRSDRRIGPLRHVIENLMTTATDPILSGVHVELVNLRAPQLYTTNYDNLLEKTYKTLGLQASVVALPKDIATASSGQTQIVKYHGDLRFESTLVLTESAYYKRLDLESPMDLKFRSDILGKSVLFMGYSFRDVNIRLIWFKLMQMMKDVAPDDRHKSYIVKLEPNPLQDALFKDVGLTPITLDPNGVYKPSDQKKLLADFLNLLASSAYSASPVKDQPEMFVSSTLLDSIPPLHSQGSHELASRPFGSGGYLPGYPAGRWRPSVEFLKRTVPVALESEGADRFRSILASHVRSNLPIASVSDKARQFGSSPELTVWIAYVLAGGSTDMHNLRDKLLVFPDFPWGLIWAEVLPKAEARELIRSFKTEVDWNLQGHGDSDIIYLADIMNRILAGMSEDDPAAARAARVQLVRASVLYPELRSMEVELSGPPAVAEAIEASGRRIAELEDPDGDEEEDMDESFMLNEPLEDDLFVESESKPDLESEPEPEPEPEPAQ